MEQEPHDPEHKLIWQEIQFLKDELKNHVYSKLERLDNRLWWIIGIIIAGIVAGRIF